MESFELDKGYIIRSVLEYPFRKVVLDHLVVDDKLTRKCRVMSDISDEWSCQYRPLEYVFDDAFSGIMCSVDVDELLGVVSNLPEGKAAGLSGILNEL
ncbi:hypothetical protein G9A89_014627 [Geosiphon pyriformis]|nr:hypothetical protein G9A89_014627 [Geosiphon pyriformis]